MAEKKKTATADETPMDGVKKAIGKAADLTSLRLKLRRTISRRKEAYTRLGELAYEKYRPRKNAVTQDIESAIAATVTEITELSHEITELSLRVEILRADAKK